MRTLALIGAGVVVAIAVAAFVGFQLFLTSDLVAAFCELVNALQIAIEAGQDIKAAAGEFLDGFTDDMIDALPEEYQEAARTLVSVLKSTVAFVSGIVGALIGDFVADALEAVGRMDGLCSVVR